MSPAATTAIAIVALAALALLLTRRRTGGCWSPWSRSSTLQLPDSMKRAMARQAEAEREKRAKIIAAEGEALAADRLAVAADIMIAHPLSLQLRNLQSLVEIGVDKTPPSFPGSTDEHHPGARDIPGAREGGERGASAAARRHTHSEERRPEDPT